MKNKTIWLQPGQCKQKWQLDKLLTSKIQATPSSATFNQNNDNQKKKDTAWENDECDEPIWLIQRRANSFTWNSLITKFSLLHAFQI